jgi:hypothetical protein
MQGEITRHYGAPPRTFSEKAAQDVTEDEDDWFKRWLSGLLPLDTPFETVNRMLPRYKNKRKVEDILDSRRIASSLFKDEDADEGISNPVEEW